jgi:sugar/nucleoside kinase (ribokinase family)
VVVIVLLTSTESELDPHRRQVADKLQREANGDYTIRFPPASATPKEHVAAIRDADIVVCIVGDSNGPELPDGTGCAETEVMTARRLGIDVLAYARDDEHVPTGPRDPLHEYSVARARRFRHWLREHYGIRRFSTPRDLVTSVAEDVNALRSDARVVGPSVVRQLHRRVQASGRIAFDAAAVSLHNMDAIYRLEQIAPGREEYVDPPQVSPGGGGANVVYTLARLGAATAVAGCTASDADGAALRTNLEEGGVNTDFLLQLERGSPLRTGRTTILTDGSGQQTILTETGANSRFAAEVAARGLREPLLQALTRSRIVLLTSFSTVAERRLQEDLLEHLPVDTLVAFTPGSLYMNPGSRLAPLIARANVIFISEEALGRLLDELVPDFSDDSTSIPRKAHALIKWRHELGSHHPLMLVVMQQRGGYQARGRLRQIFVCWGQQGYEGGVGTDGRSSSDDVDKVVDRTGTGGALAAGVLYGLLRSRPPEDCANLAYVLAMSATTRYGSRSGLPSRQEIAEHWCHWLKTDVAPDWLGPSG